MALTSEILKANVTDITDDQIKVITTLSANDESAIIGTKVGEIYGTIDKILAETGIEKVGAEKTSEYAKRVLSEYKAKVDGSSGLQSQLDALTKEKERLEKTIAEGTGDAETAKALAQAKADFASVTTQFNELKSKYDQSEQDYQKKLFGVRIESELHGATSNVKFKAGLPESATKVLISQAVEKIKSLQPEYIDDGNGGKVIAFKDETGAIMRNPNNQLNPYTPADLLTKELETMGILDKGRKAEGAGTKPPKAGAGSGGASIDVSGARTQTEAYEAIASTLMANGVPAGTDKFQQTVDAVWKEANISALPEK